MAGTHRYFLTSLQSLGNCGHIGLLLRRSIQLKTLSACVLVAGTHRYFLTSLQSFGNCGHLGLLLRRSIQLKTLSACVLVAETQIFPRQPIDCSQSIFHFVPQESWLDYPASKVIGIVASLVSNNTRDPRPPQELTLFCTDHN